MKNKNFRANRKYNYLFLMCIVSILLIICLLMGCWLWKKSHMNAGQEVLQTMTGQESSQITEGQEISQTSTESAETGSQADSNPANSDPDHIPAYEGAPYVELSGNKPSFAEEDLTTDAFEHYSDLDELGRCGTAYANVCPDTMPDEVRGAIGEIHPSGWQISNYHDLIDGNYLYNRCHLIAYSLTGENANEKNLITGTRYLNTEGMQPFELEVLEYVRDTGNHVLYRVKPVFEGDNLVASGVIMEGMSVEDHGGAISFHIYAYNVQPGVIIDYETGNNKPDPDYDGGQNGSRKAVLEEGESEKSESDEERLEDAGSEDSYVLNTNTHKFHRPSCDSVADMKDKNKEISNESRQEILKKGYEPCGRCKP